MLDSNSYGLAQILKLRGYREQLDSLLTQYRQECPDVQALRITIAEILANDGVEDDGIKHIGACDSVDFDPVCQELKAEIYKAGVEGETMKVRLAEKERNVEELKKSIDIISEVEAKREKLNRDYEITREHYLDLVEGWESARLAQEVGQSGSNIIFRTVEPPGISAKSLGSNRLLLLTEFLFAAKAAVLRLDFLRYLILPAFIETNQIKKRAGLEVLGPAGIYLAPKHNKRRQLQLTLFTMVLLLLTSLYIGVLLFKRSWQSPVGVLLSQRGISI